MYVCMYTHMLFYMCLCYMCLCLMKYKSMWLSMVYSYNIGVIYPSSLIFTSVFPCPPPQLKGFLVFPKFFKKHFDVTKFWCDKFKISWIWQCRTYRWGESTVFIIHMCIWWEILKNVLKATPIRQREKKRHERFTSEGVSDDSLVWRSQALSKQLSTPLQKNLIIMATAVVPTPWQLKDDWGSGLPRDIASQCRDLVWTCILQSC